MSRYLNSYTKEMWYRRASLEEADLAQVLLLVNCEITGITFLSPYLSKMRITNTFFACFEN